MSNTVFTPIPYELRHLLNDIELGVIGLPDIQRPFVWPNAKVRDLLDSMYRGYPVGHLLFWRHGIKDDRTIGQDEKRKTPEKVIVDGQQRLTSLYAVMTGRPIVDRNWRERTIQIAFNPMEERFDVANAAIRQNKSFIGDISTIWSNSIVRVSIDYKETLPSNVDPETEKRALFAIEKLYGLKNFPFQALELSASVTEEDIAEVFVRINSKGTSLKQADFILTLMSVFWDQGRKDLEQFCRDAKTPAKDAAASPFNRFIEPKPDQLLRVTIGVGFRRAQLRHCYSLLRGKDVETGGFSKENRDRQFEELRRAQELTLNMRHWHDFMICVRLAGFRNGKMISSQTNLLFSYTLYLIGRTEYGVDAVALRRAIAQWFFMSAATGRFTGSPEGAMEFDLGRLRDVRDADGFVHELKKVCRTALTGDFWKTTLPNALATAAPRSPSFLAYNAALVLLEAPVLYSNTPMADALDPSVSSGREVEKHHLFPRRHLERIRLGGAKNTNQNANFAYVDRSDNARVGDKAPEAYVPNLEERFSAEEIGRMYRFHALPDGWERMEYRKFLAHRRDLIAKITKEGYDRLADDVGAEDDHDIDWTMEISSGESGDREFKSTLRINLHTGAKDGRMELGVLKTLAAFLNTNGGTLFVGVADDGTPVGIGEDGFGSEDKMSLHLVNIVSQRMGVETMAQVRPHFEDYEGVRVLVVRCSKARRPVYVKDGRAERFFVRAGPATRELTAREVVDYVEATWT